MSIQDIEPIPNIEKLLVALIIDVVARFWAWRTLRTLKRNDERRKRRLEYLSESPNGYSPRRTTLNHT
jgi:hypothetical protein